MELARGVQLKGVVLALGVRHDEIQLAQQVQLKGVVLALRVQQRQTA